MKQETASCRISPCLLPCDGGLVGQLTACSDGLKMAGWAGLVPDGTVPAGFYCSGWMDLLDGKDAGRRCSTFGWRYKPFGCSSKNQPSQGF